MNGPMRVLHVIPALAPRYGGPSTALLPMTEALQATGRVAVEIATTDADGAGQTLAPALRPQSVVPIHWFPRTWSERWKYSGPLATWLARHVGDYHIVHAHALWSHSTFAASRAARRARVPLVVRPCGMMSPYTFGRAAWLKRPYWWWCEKPNLHGAAFHATSQGEAAEVREHFPLAQTVVLPLGLPPAAWNTPTQRGSIRARYRITATTPLVLFLSRLHPKKGVLDILLPAWQNVTAEGHLLLLGGPDEHAPELEADVRSAITRLGLADRVTLGGSIVPEDRWAAYDDADLFVLPSQAENFGVVVAEAMARGVPVLVSTGVQSGHHVEAAGAGKVLPRTVAAFSDAMDRMLRNPTERLDMGRAGRLYGMVQFTWERHAAGLIELYSTLMDHSNR